MEKSQKLTILTNQIKNCQKCPLYKGSTQAVPGTGNPEAEVMFIGEAPGFFEDQKGEPFVGNAGHLLDELIKMIGLLRTEVFITNVVKHRPPQNRDPKEEEIKACTGWLDKQIEIINPKMIVTLGRFSLAKFCPGLLISKIHGQPQRTGSLVVLPLFHPAAALRDGQIAEKLEADFQKIPKILVNPQDFQLDAQDEQNQKSEAKQTSLF